MVRNGRPRPCPYDMFADWVGRLARLPDLRQIWKLFLHRFTAEMLIVAKRTSSPETLAVTSRCLSEHLTDSTIAFI